MMGILAALGIIVAANLIGVAADHFGGDSNWWTRMAYAFAIGALCSVLWQ